VRGGDLSPPTDDLRLFDIAVEVDAGGGSVTIDIQGELDWINVASGVTNGQRVTTDEHGVAVRATWTGGSGGTMNVYASPKYNGAL
jgi:hypothetical protein